MPAEAGIKAPDAFRTIGELSAELGVAQHILRYWETKFPQLKPLQRAGNRRYYRPSDVELARRIHRLLNHEGYTVRGVQKVLRDERGPRSADATAIPFAPPAQEEDPPHNGLAVSVDDLRLLRNHLARALDD